LARITNDYGSNALAAAMTFAVAVAAFALAGHWVDGKLATTPVFLVVGCLLGCAGGMLHMLRRLAPRRRLEKDGEKE
jgi:F0F1-type ATP synthase assembly protein I